MLPIAVDAMGGDRSPGEIVEGAKLAAAAGIPIVLVGPPDLAGRVDIGDLPLITASEVIAMDEDPAGGVRRKKDSTLVRAAEAVRDGTASAMISAGNTGATMASALLRMGRIKGVSRPGIATPIPVLGSTPTILLDCGANAEVQPEWLVQFAQMGSVFSHQRFGVAVPRVGLLSIGEEPYKGDTLRKEAYDLLGEAQGIEFIGNIEGRDLMTDGVDVAVTDGFTGNVVLKTCEGIAEGLFGMVRQEIEAAVVGEVALARLGAALAPALQSVARRIDYTEVGGALLAGVHGSAVIAHGRSDAAAIANAIRAAARFAEQKLPDQLAAAMKPA